MGRTAFEEDIGPTTGKSKERDTRGIPDFGAQSEKGKWRKKTSRRSEGEGKTHSWVLNR